MRWLIAIILAVSHIATAGTRVAGDLAPLGNPDGVLNAGDLVVLTRIVQGDLLPSDLERLVGDVAPVGNPDGVLNAGDLLVLTRAVLGELALADVFIGPDAPQLTSLPAQTALNPVPLNGVAAPGMEVRVYVNGVLQQVIQSSVVDGSFTASVRLDDGANVVYVTAWDGALESQPSTSSTINYNNTINRTQTAASIAEDTVWTSGSPATPYTISGSLSVDPGVTLYIQPGTVLRFEKGASLKVSGGLSLSGTLTAPVQLTSTSLTPRTGDWQGVTVESGASEITLRNVEIQWADIGVDVTGMQTVSISNSSIRYSRTAGLWMRPGSGGAITDTLIEYSGINYSSTDFSSKAIGIRLTGASPTITRCTLKSHSYGLYAEQGASPVITGSTFSNNDYGLGAFGDYFSAANNPTPVVKRNAFYNNGVYAYIAGGYIDATNPSDVTQVSIEQDLSENWWGSTDPSIVSGSVYDYARARGISTPIARLVPFLDSENGLPITTNYLNGLIRQSTTIPANTLNTVVGSLVVKSSAVLTVDEGAQISFAKASTLSAHGNLWVQGTAVNPVIFSSLSATPQAGDWIGISMYADGNNLEGANIRYASESVEIFGDQTTITGNTISDFSQEGIEINGGVIQAGIANNTLTNSIRGGNGIRFDAVSDGKVVGNTIKNTRTGINIALSGPVITNNEILNSNSGIYIMGDVPKGFLVAPRITGNLISGNVYGINITKGSNRKREDVNPVIQNNRILNNTTFNYYIQGFGPEAVLDAKFNWWGSEDEAVITAGLNSNQIQYSPYLGSNSNVIYSSRNEGVISQDTIWSSSNSPYVLTDSVIIPVGIRLTIEAGARIEFSPGARLIVNGTLDLKTTYAAPAILTASVVNPTTADYWGGMLIKNGNQVIQHLNIENVRTGIEVNASNVSVRYSNFVNCSISCLAYLGASDSIVSGVFENNHLIANNRSSARGIKIAFASPIVRGNHIEEAAYGIEISARSGSAVLFNWVENNKTGVYIHSGSENGSYWDPSARVQGNNLLNNTRYNYETGRFQVSPNKYLAADDNWWGTTIDSEVQAGIYDDVDGLSYLPTAVYLPYATDFIPMPPELTSPATLTKQGSYTASGVALPNAGIRIFIGGVQKTQIVADAAGKYSAAVLLSEGLNQITARSFTATRESADSNSIDVTLDTTPPVITVTSLVSGALTNQTNQYFSGRVSGAFSLTINGQSVVIKQDKSFNFGPVMLAEGVNIFELIATDAAGNVTTEQMNLALDTTPPVDPNMALVSFSVPSGGIVSVTGLAGSVEAGTLATIVNARTGAAASVAAAADGSFVASISAEPGDSLSLVDADTQGNQAAWAQASVAGTPAPVSISNIQPLSGSIINDDVVSISGNVQGSANTGVVVNGRTAAIYDGQFAVTGLPLQPGANSINITATEPDGTQVTQTITLTSGGSLPYEITVSPDTGIAPLNVVLNVTNNSSNAVQLVEIDMENDGAPEYSANSLSAGETQVNSRYATAGLYHGSARILDDSGTETILPFIVVVEDRIGMTARLRSVYDTMLSQLRSGDIVSGLNQISGTSRSRYQTIFNELGANLATAITGLGDIRDVVMGNGWTELILVRDPGGTKTAFRINLIKGQDGVWRIESM